MFREPTNEERKDFIPIATTGGTAFINPEEIFRGEVAKRVLLAQQQGKPFADKALLKEWRSWLTAERKRIENKLGYYDPSQVKQMAVDWETYSNLANFDVLDEGETYDDHLTRRHNVHVMVHFKVYQFKGHYEKYTMMEDGLLAVQRAKKLLHEQDAPRKVSK